MEYTIGMMYFHLPGIKTSLIMLMHIVIITILVLINVNGFTCIWVYILGDQLAKSEEAKALEPFVLTNLVAVKPLTVTPVNDGESPVPTPISIVSVPPSISVMVIIPVSVA